MSFTMCGGSIVLYDESPLEPDQHILPKLAAKTKSTMIGMGAKLYDEYTKMDVDFSKRNRAYHLLFKFRFPLWSQQSSDGLFHGLTPQAVCLRIYQQMSGSRSKLPCIAIPHLFSKLSVRFRVALILSAALWVALFPSLFIQANVSVSTLD